MVKVPYRTSTVAILSLIRALKWREITLGRLTYQRYANNKLCKYEIYRKKIRQIKTGEETRRQDKTAFYRVYRKWRGQLLVAVHVLVNVSLILMSISISSHNVWYWDDATGSTISPFVAFSLSSHIDSHLIFETKFNFLVLFYSLH